MRLLVLATTMTLVLLPALGGCDGLDGGKGRGKNPPPTTTDPNGDGPRPVDVTRPAFQAKSSTQLARSIDSCVGAGTMTVTAAMIASEENPQGFLTSDFAAGDDIVARQATLFDGTLDALRTGVRVDQVSLEYVTALKNVANVVGTRCASGAVATPSMCTCGSEPEARAMLERCLVAVADPSSADFAELAKSFHVACEKNRGSAIASMIASLAFAKIP